MVWLSEGEKFEDMFIRFDRMYERDRHTGRQTDRHGMTAQQNMVIKQTKMLKNSIELEVVIDSIELQL